MSTFICEKCGCIDNTACGGTYWEVALARKTDKKEDLLFADDFYNKHPVCVACAPKEYIDGSKNEEAGEWHNRFPRRHWTELFHDLHELALANNESTGDFVNARTYVKQVKMGRLKESLTKSW